MLMSKKKQYGFSMIEILVSVLVIGVGLLGLSGLQIASFKSTNNAHSRNVATNLAMELSERMRANRDGVNAGFYENTVTCATAETQCNTGTFCTPEQIAKFDTQELMCGVLIPADEDVEGSTSSREGGALNLLPNGTIDIDHNVNCDTTIDNDNETTITVSWRLLEEHQDQQRAGNSQTTNIEICVVP